METNSLLASIIALGLGIPFIYYFCIFIKECLQGGIESVQINHSYGKLEGEIVDKKSEVVITVLPTMPPYAYYFELQKEENGEVLTRRLYVSEVDYNKFNIGDHIKKDNLLQLVKG